MSQLILLCLFAFLAGFIDSIVGGGGLIQLPALLVILPNTPIPLIMGTNKLSAIAGTSVAAIGFAQVVKLNLITIISAIAAFIFSFIGARIVNIIRPDILRPTILLLLIAVAIYTFFKKDFGGQYVFQTSKKTLIFAVIIGMCLGFYDGFFGPGTGSFLIFAFIGILGFDFLRASASAKIINFSTNLSALIYFASTNNVIYHLALPMAGFNIFGAILGTKLAIAKGNGFIRIVFLIVVSALIVKLAYDLYL